MALRVAFVGFQHGHAFSLYNDLKNSPDIELVAACEEDEKAKVKAVDRGIAITHTDFTAMLEDVTCDAVACCDWYGIRAARLIGAMNAGKHVIADKPICTRLTELDHMAQIAQAKHLKIGCQLPVPYHPPFVTAQKLIRAGAIGVVHSVTFNGAHPLNASDRPEWMFDPDRYGGSINDIAIHGIDALPWLTGRQFTEITAAREWNAHVPEHPGYRDGGVVLLKLDNGGAAYGDVSWLSPDGAGYSTPFYWRFTIMGATGAIETSWNAEKVMLYRANAKDVVAEPLVGPGDCSYVGDWLLDIANTPALDRLYTDRILRSTRMVLATQQAARDAARDVPL